MAALSDNRPNDLQQAQEAYEEPEWARGLGLDEENMREAFVQVGDMFRNMSRAQAQIAACGSTPVKGGHKRGRVTLTRAGGTYSASYVVRGHTLKVRSAGAHRTLSLGKVTASLEEVVKLVLRTMIAQRQPALHSRR